MYKLTAELRFVYDTLHEKMIGDCSCTWKDSETKDRKGRDPGVHFATDGTIYFAKQQCAVHGVGNEKDYCSWNETEIPQLSMEIGCGDDMAELCKRYDNNSQRHAESEENDFH